MRDATTIFDQLMESERIKSRLLVVDNPDLTAEEHDRLAADVTAAILNHESLGRKVHKI